jgi:hypothetical protein
MYHPCEIKSNPTPLSKNIDAIQFSLSPVYRRRKGWGEGAEICYLGGAGRWLSTLEA